MSDGAVALGVADSSMWPAPRYLEGGGLAQTRGRVGAPVQRSSCMTCVGQVPTSAQLLGTQAGACSELSSGRIWPESGFRPIFSKFWIRSTEDRPEFARAWPNLCLAGANSGQIWPELALLPNFGATSGDFGQFGKNTNSCGATLTELGQIWTGIGQIGAHSWHLFRPSLA